uniref:Gamma-glutamyltransferase n=1 Tax=Syphacia muris TaxID=451379 RepID=A0A0N5AGB3_9BILA
MFVWFLFSVTVLLLAQNVLLEEHHDEYLKPYDWPPPSYSYLGRYSRAAVTSDHGICSEIGRNVLLRGGNAADASIASLFCLGITNPQSSGIGGGFIMTFYNRTTQRCHVIDARETAPANTFRDMFLNDEFGSKYGYRAIATPGEIAGYWLVYKKYGSGKVPWHDLIQPSIELARNGVPVSEYLGYVLSIKEKHFRTLPSMQSWINQKTNKTFVAGDLIKRPELARTLEVLAKSKDPVELFYRGKMAKIIVDEIQANGGILTMEDLANFKPKEYDQPLINDHFSGDLVMCGPPPPGSFAITQLIITLMAKFYAPMSDKRILYSDPTFYHRLIEAQKFAYAQRTLMGDESFVESARLLAEKMTTKEYADEVFKKFKSYAQPSSYYGGINQTQPPDHGTSHVCVLDAEGNGFSTTTTVNRWFGAVVQSEKLGIVWNDEMDDFSTPGMVNGFGFAPSETNFIAPGKKPMSSMSPIVIYNKRTGDLRMVIGASGGSKIISAMAKPIVRVLFFNETMKEGIDAPTLHNQFTPDITQYHEVPAQLLEDLQGRFGQKFRNTTGFEGIVQGIDITDHGIYANGDFRRKADQHPGGY